MTITSADAESVRRFYMALAARDLADLQSSFAGDAMRHSPGKSPIGGGGRDG
jgi:ketosteroid isomerase-like protein